MSAKSIVAGGFLALAALVASTSTAQAQFIGSRTVVTTATGYRAPIYQHYNHGSFGTPLVTSSYFPQVVPYYQQPVFVNRFYGNNFYDGGFDNGFGNGFGNGFNNGFGGGFGNGFGGGFGNGFGGGFGRPGVILGFNFR